MAGCGSTGLPVSMTGGEAVLGGPRSDSCGSTPGGTESGSEPILELHRADEVKDLGAANRGRRKVGIESAAGEDELASASAHRRRAGANMMWIGTAGCWRSFWECRCEVAFSPMMPGPSAEMVHWCICLHPSRLIRDFRT